MSDDRQQRPPAPLPTQQTPTSREVEAVDGRGDRQVTNPVPLRLDYRPPPRLRNEPPERWPEWARELVMLGCCALFVVILVAVAGLIQSAL